MTIESSENKPLRKSKLLEKAEKLLALKPTRLPKGIRDYIRTIKESGELERAEAVYRLEKEQKTKRKVLNALDQLQTTVVEIIENNDGDVVDLLTKQVRAIWILNGLGLINGKERYEQLKEVIDSQSPDIQTRLEAKMPAVRDEMHSLFPGRKI